MGDDLIELSKARLNTSNNGKKDCYNRGKMSDQKLSMFWSPQEENKLLLKHKYISCSRSVPRRNKRFLHYRTSRSLNLEANSHNSTSENSSCEEDKYLSRSAKIMRALNFNSSPSYYGKTKIKRSLNFNLTPSPKTFTRSNGRVRKALSMNLSSSSNDSKGFPNTNKSPLNDSANNSLLFASCDSIDENQNETPSQRNTRGQKLMNFSTPDARVDIKTPGSVNFTPVLRTGLNEMIDDMEHIPDTPMQQSSRCNKSRLKYTDDVAKSTPRNLFRDFHDDDDDEDDDNRPRTPENLIRVIPESMSAIKRSHKKERTSRWGERGSAKSAKVSPESIKSTSESASPKKRNRTFGNSMNDCDSMKGSFLVDESWNEMPTCNSEGDLSDTGSIFDYYAEEQKLHLSGSLNESNVIVDPVQEYGDDLVPFTKCEELQEQKENVGELKLDDATESSSRIRENSESFERLDEMDLNDSLDENVDVKTEFRSVTPEFEEPASEDASKPVTPDNSRNLLQHVLRDSIKKSHKKSKDDNRRRLLSPKGLRCKTEVTKVKENETSSRHSDLSENVEKIDLPESPSTSRAVTPERVNSSRLLLSQFSSVKKSHKKDKHNKILSGFLKRQEYFQRDMNFVANTTETIPVVKVSEYRGSSDALALDLDSSSSVGIGTFERNIGSQEGTAAVDKLSPSKRKKPLDAPMERDRVDVLGDFESRRYDTATEEFRIFTPLKRRRSLNTSVEKEEYLCVYRLPSGDNDTSDEPVSDIGLSRCVTPVASFRDNYVRSDEIEIDAESGATGNGVNCMVKAEDEDQGSAICCETRDNDSKDITGRSTPKNMSTAELYFNIDSIKKSHKKTKRGSTSRKGRALDGDKTRVVEANRSTEQRLSEVENFQRDSPERYHFVEAADHAETSITNESNVQTIDEKTATLTGRRDANEEGTATATTSSNKTPPNCLKVKNYIKLLQDTSIKRSHKKVRNRRKQEPIVVFSELSDDGSIFGDEEKLSFMEDRSTTDIVDPDFVDVCEHE